MKRIYNIVTCGDVDSGKSTLLGRLLYNTNNIYDDQLADIKKASEKYGQNNRLEYGLLFDGLLEERKQQITIDVAHRFFNINDTRFHLLDCPGHVQYTHNFVIAAIEADMAILVIDATKGIMPQTFVHLDICKLFNISEIVLAITKVDLVNEFILHNLERDIAEKISGNNYKIFRTSAFENININQLADYIYEVSIKPKNVSPNFAVCVQSVKKIKNKRFYHGISFGSPFESEIANVYPGAITCNIFKCPEGVDVYSLDKDIDISRGYIITNIKLCNTKVIKGRFVKFLDDFSSTNLIFKYGTGTYKIKHLSENCIELEDSINICNISDLKNLGYGLVIDNETKLNAGLFVIFDNYKQDKYHCFWFTGYSGSGKTTLAKALADFFAVRPIVLDGDDIRSSINYDLTLNDKDRDENVKKIANLAKLLLNQGFNVIVSCISKDYRQRNYARNLLKDAYVEIFVESSEQTRKKRDTKGLYRNNIMPLEGYEKSDWDYIKINTDDVSIEQSVAELIKKLENYL